MAGNPLFFSSTSSTLFSAIAIVISSSCDSDQSKNRSWSVYKADAQSTSYSPLTEITKENISHLKLAWTFNPNDARKGGRPGNAECNPIIVDGVMYATSARHRLYAIEANTGKLLW